MSMLSSIVYQLSRTTSKYINFRSVCVGPNAECESNNIIITSEIRLNINKSTNIAQVGPLMLLNKHQSINALDMFKLEAKTRRCWVCVDVTLKTKVFVRVPVCLFQRVEEKVIKEKVNR